MCYDTKPCSTSPEVSHTKYQQHLWLWYMGTALGLHIKQPKSNPNLRIRNWKGDRQRVILRYAESTQGFAGSVPTCWAVCGPGVLGQAEACTAGPGALQPPLSGQPGPGRGKLRLWIVKLKKGETFSRRLSLGHYYRVKFAPRVAVIGTHSSAVTAASTGTGKSCCGNPGDKFPAFPSLIFQLQVSFKLSV